MRLLTLLEREKELHVRKALIALLGLVPATMLAMAPALAEVKPAPAKPSANQNKVVMGTVNGTAKR